MALTFDVFNANYRFRIAFVNIIQSRAFNNNKRMLTEPEFYAGAGEFA